MPLVCWYVSRILDQLLLFSNNTDYMYQAGFCFYYIVILMFNSYFYFVTRPTNQLNQSQLVIIKPLLSNHPISLVIMTAPPLARSHSSIYSTLYLHPYQIKYEVTFLFSIYICTYLPLRDSAFLSTIMLLAIDNILILSLSVDILTGSLTIMNYIISDKSKLSWWNR